MDTETMTIAQLIADLKTEVNSLKRQLAQERASKKRVIDLAVRGLTPFANWSIYVRDGNGGIQLKPNAIDGDNVSTACYSNHRIKEVANAEQSEIEEVKPLTWRDTPQKIRILREYRTAFGGVIYKIMPGEIYDVIPPSFSLPDTTPHRCIDINGNRITIHEGDFEFVTEEVQS